jgi:N utilization substance protein B
MSGPRRRSRAIALQIMHQMDVSPEMSAEAALSLYFGQLAAGDAGDEPDEPRMAPGRADRALVESLVRGVAEHRDDLQAMLAAVSKNWRVERMAVVDRNVIRLALYELKYCPEVPVSVAINEAIELAKEFGSGEAGAFVNGLLDRAATELNLRR